MSERRYLAKLHDFDILVEDHGWAVMGGHFEYDEGGCQGLGCIIDMDFVKQFMAVFGAEYLRQVNGKSCWVVFDDESNFYSGTSSNIIRIDPLHKNSGVPFDIKHWANLKRAATA